MWLAIMIQSAFADKLIVEDRDPIGIVNAPSFLRGGTYGILLPKVAFWTELTIVSVT